MSGHGKQQCCCNNDNKSNQCNPNNPEYGGHKPGYQGDKQQANLDNHSDQLNPNNPKKSETPKK